MYLFFWYNNLSPLALCSTSLSHFQYRSYHQEYVLFSRRTHPSPINLELTIPAFDPLPPQYFIRAVSDSWVGSEVLLPVSFQHLMMPDQSMPYTDLMDLTPLPTSALGNKQFEQLYTKFETFNPIQTQRKQIYNSKCIYPNDAHSSNCLFVENISVPCFVSHWCSRFTRSSNRFW